MQLIKKSNLHNYQLEVVKQIKEKKKVALFLEMSLGKTISTLTALSELLATNKIQKVLIIAPLRVANTVWKQEAEKWEHTYWLANQMAICTGSVKDKIKAITSKHKILITNKDNLTWLGVNARHCNYDCVIIDESSAFKSASTQRFKAIRKTCIDSTYTLLLTGTPSPNSLMDLWPQIFLLDQGKRLGKTISSYRQRFFYRDGFMGYNWKPFKESQEKIQELLKDICITLKTKDYIELPEKIMVNAICELPEKAYKIYKQMDDEFIFEVNDDKIEAINAATKANKLLQLANGFMYDENKIAHEFHQTKIDTLKEIIENNPNENILIAYNFQHDLIMLQREFKDAILLDKEGKNVKLWNDGKIKLLLAHPASAGHGLNLQSGGNIIVWYSLTWSLENYLQFNARLHRQGQQKPVRIIHLIAKKTNDERVMKVLNMKDATQENLLNKLKLILFAEKMDI